jgi:ribosomal protein S18 acetylase RimI-like enzyme
LLGGGVRVATDADLDRVTKTLWLAFRDDPLWGWAFPEREKLEPWWRFLIRSALRHRSVWVLGDCAAVSVWIPPGCDELSHEEEQQVEGLLEELVGNRASQIMELLERFEASHPRETPHYYLSLLGTHPDHRGHGLGMSLLAENLRRIDEQGMPAYLESSNPANDLRYESLGFKRVGELSTPDASRTASTMWRAPVIGAPT